MSSSVPTVYLLHGEDDFEISNFIKTVKSKLGDETAQDMNVTWVDSKKFDLEGLR
jgi:DNA polymerase III delta subunit